MRRARSTRADLGRGPARLPCRSLSSERQDRYAACAARQASSRRERPREGERQGARIAESQARRPHAQPTACPERSVRSAPVCLPPPHPQAGARVRLTRLGRVENRRWPQLPPIMPQSSSPMEKPSSCDCARNCLVKTSNHVHRERDGGTEGGREGRRARAGRRAGWRAGRRASPASTRAPASRTHCICCLPPTQRKPRQTRAVMSGSRAGTAAPAARSMRTATGGTEPRRAYLGGELSGRRCGLLHSHELFAEH